MVGNRQVETLQKYARWVSDANEPVEVQVRIRPWRHFTREAGGGSGYPVIMMLVYTTNGDNEQVDYTSTCRSHHTAIEKAKELARYLRDELKVDADKIRVRDES